MGCLLSSEERAALRRSREIDEMLRLEAKRKQEMETKDAEILLIGTRHCGKSSFLKQIKTIFCDTASCTAVEQNAVHINDKSVVQFTYKDVHFRIMELESHLLNRRKLYHYFENVKAIIILVGICNYDHVTDDDPPKNVLIESMELFELICHDKSFEDPLLFLFLSKKDLFEEKLKTTPLSVCFTNYSGPNTFDDAGAYIYSKFEHYCDVDKTGKEIHTTHFINTADTNNVAFVMDAVTDAIIQSYWRVHYAFYGMFP